MNESSDRLRHIIDRVKVKTRAAIDNDLRVLRSMYQSKNEREKKIIKDWIAEAATVANKGLGIRPNAVLIVEFVEPDTDGDDLAVSTTYRYWRSV